ncbi:hypothetical protein IGK51_001576 [Enterococcus sp. DIV0098]
MMSIEKFTAFCFIGFLLWLLVMGVIDYNKYYRK